MRFCLCCGSTPETPTIPSCWNHWQLLPEDLRSAIIKSSARGQLTLYAKAVTQAVAIWRKAGAWRPIGRASQISAAPHGSSNVMSVAVLQRWLQSDYGNEAKERAALGAAAANVRNFGHEPQTRTRPDAPPTAEKHRADVAVLRTFSTQRGDEIRAAHPAVGRRRIERSATAHRTMHGGWQQGRGLAASRLGR